MIKLKICGMKDPANIKEVGDLNPELLGFIFYQGSKRFIEDLDPQVLSELPENIGRVGVFVNHELIDVVQIAEKFSLNFLQLHGNESEAYITALKQQLVGSQIQIIKAFGVDESFDFSELESYQSVVDYFLFDTQTPNHGGSGKQFDWALLQRYTLSKPYFLSGGIGLESIDTLKMINDNRLYAIDINSKFETVPGQKDIGKLKEFKGRL